MTVTSGKEPFLGYRSAHFATYSVTVCLVGRGCYVHVMSVCVLVGEGVTHVHIMSVCVLVGEGVTHVHVMSVSGTVSVASKSGGKSCCYIRYQ